MQTTTLCPSHMKKLLDAAVNKTAEVIMDSMKSAASMDSDHAHHNHQMEQPAANPMGHHHMGHQMGDDDMMIMYFHGGYKEVVLFDFWRTKSVGIFVLTCFILFVVGALYEGLKLLRETLIRNEIAHVAAKEQSAPIGSRLLSRSHLIQTLLHMAQVTISYLLMLVFMTYNSWLCLSVVLGAGCGYFFFGFKRLTTIDVNEHCH